MQARGIYWTALSYNLHASSARNLRCAVRSIYAYIIKQNTADLESNPCQPCFYIGLKLTEVSLQQTLKSLAIESFGIK